MPKRSKGLRKEIRENWVLYLMAAPAVVALFIFSYLPMAGLVMAFQNLNIAKGIFQKPLRRI